MRARIFSRRTGIGERRHTSAEGRARIGGAGTNRVPKPPIRVHRSTKAQVARKTSCRRRRFWCALLARRAEDDMLCARIASRVPRLAIPVRPIEVARREVPCSGGREERRACDGKDAPCGRRDRGAACRGTGRARLDPCPGSGVWGGRRHPPRPRREGHRSPVARASCPHGRSGASRWRGGGAVLHEAVAHGLGPLAVGLVALAGLICAARLSTHRGFSHSLLALVGCAGATYLVCPPLAPYAALGFATHLALDALTYRGLRLFWPLRRGLSLRLCHTGGVVDACCLAVATLAIIITVASAALA